MISHQHIRIPSRRHKNSIHPTPNRRHKDPTNLQPYQKRKRHDHRRKLPSLIVPRFCELQVEVGEEGAEVGDERGAHSKDGPDEAIIDKSINAAVFHHGPGVFCGGDVGFAVEGDVGEGVAVDESVGGEG